MLSWSLASDQESGEIGQEVMWMWCRKQWKCDFSSRLCFDERLFLQPLCVGGIEQGERVSPPVETGKPAPRGAAAPGRGQVISGSRDVCAVHRRLHLPVFLLDVGLSVTL